MTTTLTEQDYLLVCLGEEAAEVAHAVAKCLRFGLNNQRPGRMMTNRDCLRDEVRDLLRLAERLELSTEGLADKGEKFANAMALSRALGRLEGAPNWQDVTIEELERPQPTTLAQVQRKLDGYRAAVERLNRLLDALRRKESHAP